MVGAMSTNDSDNENVHSMESAAASSQFGISAIETYQPSWSLANEWFRGTIARKFVHHTGTQARLISSEDEVTMAMHATNNLRREVGCDLQSCAAVVFVSPSFIPLSVARKYLGEQQAR